MVLAFITLAFMEIILGIDNIVFISLVSDRLDEKRKARARVIGLALALILRIVLLFSIKWVMSLTKPLFEVLSHSFTGKDLVLLFGGLFLVYKAVKEIVHLVEPEHEKTVNGKAKSFMGVLAQIIVLDLVFSLDSVITAVGMAKEISIMVAAMCFAMVVMLTLAKTVTELLDKHPSLKMLAVSFLLLIGFLLMSEGLGHHVPKGYIYFALFFSLGVEFLNIKTKR